MLLWGGCATVVDIVATANGRAESTATGVHVPRSAVTSTSDTITVTMASALSSTESLSLLSLSLACVGVLANTLHGDGEPLVASIALSGLAFAFCYALIRWLGEAFAKRGFKGKDLCKLKQIEM